MLPPTCSSPPCMNIDVKIVAVGLGNSSGAGQAPLSRHGITPNSKTNAWAAR